MEKDKIVNFPKLIYQLFNANVVIEKTREKSGKDSMSEAICVLPNGSQLKDSIQRYCPKHKTLKVDKHKVCVKKPCPKCKTMLKYVCSKRNTKQYSKYDNLRVHWNKCEQNVDTCKKLNPSDYLVANASIDYAREIIRYCSMCDKPVENCPKWIDRVCQNCNHHLLYQCNNCKTQYNNSLFYHMRNKCYVSKCNQCDFTNSTWAGIRQHVCRIHSVIKFPCSWCDTLFKNKDSLRYHLKSCGLES